MKIGSGRICLRLGRTSLKPGGMQPWGSRKWQTAGTMLVQCPTARLRPPHDSCATPCSAAACTAKRLRESVASAASACCDSLLHAESLIQLGLIPKPCSHMLRVPHVRQSYNWCASSWFMIPLRGHLPWHVLPGDGRY